jgi:hypothetical protein
MRGLARPAEAKPAQIFRTMDFSPLQGLRLAKVSNRPEVLNGPGGTEAD